ncbi:hypothetical protein FNF28_03659 [Cafeteria roenbergensis]|nr:hypothetical protein FNF28_03659 [Cafeteria roenbergensis]
MVNEMAAPDLLPYKADLVWKTRSLLKEQEEGLARQATQSVELAAVSTIYLLEADRVRYVLANYLRTRLHKIRCQVYGLVGMQPRARRELLSREEETFVQRLFVALGDHLTDEVLAQVPEKYSAGIEKSMESQPSHQQMVFVEAITDDIGDVTVPGAADGSEAQTVSMQAGSTFVLPFSIARPLVATDKLVLMCDTRQVQ